MSNLPFYGFTDKSYAKTTQGDTIQKLILKCIHSRSIIANEKTKPNIRIENL